ncbi:hypothetical protein [Aeromonas veronii]|uniref:hypothetical protein n=1 Tax=Aeromonas veronii TaxID=654 RepID=UPI003B9F6E89
MIKAVFLLGALFSASLMAFSVDSMFKVDDGKEGHLLLKNTTGRTEFISIRLSRVSIENEKIREQPFDTSDFLRWPMYLTPSSIILDPGAAERVSIVRVNKENKEDVMIGISLMPDILSSYGKNSMELSIGYKVWYLMPGSSEMRGELIGERNNENKFLFLRNQTNKHVSMTINFCGEVNFTDVNCTSSLFMLSGSNKSIDISALNKGKVSDVINIRYHDALKKYVKNIQI